MLIEARELDGARLNRVRDEINNEISSLGDILSAMEMSTAVNCARQNRRPRSSEGYKTDVFFVATRSYKVSMISINEPS